MNEVHVFIVNYGSSEKLEECLNSLSGHPINTVHVVDNFFSTDEQGKVAALCSNYQYVALTLVPRNVGFGPALNSAILEADLPSDDVIWILNPDTKVMPGAVVSLVGYLQQCADIVSPRIYTGDERKPRVWFDGGVFDKEEMRTRHLGLGKVFIQGEELLYEEPSFITGAAMMMFASTWRKVGGFREGLFLYWEDADLSQRAKDLGYILGVAPNAYVWHEVGGTGRTTGMSATYYYFMQRNRVWLGRQWMSRIGFLAGAAGIETLRLSLRPLKERKDPLRKTASSLKGLFHGMAQSPK